MVHEDGNVAPVDDNGRHFDSLVVYEVDDLKEKKLDLEFDPKADDFDLAEAAALEKITDVVGQHFEEACFEKLHARGIHLWLEAPEVKAGVALEAWKEGHLPEAQKGAHAVHGPDKGKRIRQHHAHGRHVSRTSDRGMQPPAHGPQV
jgi:predicted Fe-Mo cluster-binding NifX family protein